MIASRFLIRFGLAALACAWPPQVIAQDANEEQEAQEQKDEEQAVPVVRSLSFRGNEAIDDATLRLSIFTTQSSLLYRFPLTRWMGFGTKAVFDEMEFRRDVLRVQALYGVRGFPDAKVDTTMRRKGGGDIALTMHVTEGEPVRVDSLRVMGIDGVLDRSEVMEALPLKQGGPFDRLQFQTSATTLEAMLRNAGYAFATVSGGFEASDDASSVKVELTVEPGPRAKIGGIDVVGTEAVDDRVVLQALMIEPGQVFSDSALHRGQVNLQRTELFRQVGVTLIDTVPEHPNDSIVDVRIRAELAEFPLRRARLAAGYGTLDCFRLGGTLDLFNWGGDGRRLEISARTSQLGVGDPFDAGFEQGQWGPCPMLAEEDTSRLKLNYNVGATVHDPLLFSKSASAMATVFAERHTEFGAFLREEVGAEVALTRQINDNLPLQLSYAISYGRTVATPATFCRLLDVCGLEDMRIFSERRVRSVLALQVVSDRTNSVIDATQGHAVIAEIRWSPTFLGSDQFMRFTRMTAGFKSHHIVPGKGVFSWRVNVGTVFAPKVSLASGTAVYVPPEERLYGGGATTVRGFEQNQLGPVVHVIERVTDEGNAVIRTSAIGGSFMTLANVEWRFPLPVFGGRLSGAAFVDAGMVAERSAIALDDWRVTPGVGIRIASFLGPIRLDVGYNPHPPRAGPLYDLIDNELVLLNPSFRPSLTALDRFRLHLSIGQAF